MRLFLRILWAVGLGLLAGIPACAQNEAHVTCCTAAAAPPVAPIAPAGFAGWTNAVRLENELAEAVLAPDAGRLVHFARRQGISPLRLDPTLQGRSPAAGEPFFNVGGDWLWPVAQARWKALAADGRDWPPPPVLADGPWTCSAWTDAEGAQCALLRREYGAPVHIVVSRLFRLAPGSQALAVEQRIERTAASEVPVVLWNISQIARAGYIALPVEKDSKFPGGLAALMGHKPDRRQLRRCGRVAVYRVAPGAETKLGSDSPRGWIVAARDNLVVFESVANSATGDFPDGGCVVEVYANEGLGYSEIETLSPEADLAPGQVLENTLRIEIAVRDAPPAGCALAAAARALAGE